MSMQQSFDEFLEIKKQRIFGLKSVETSIAKTVLAESANYFSFKDKCRL